MIETKEQYEEIGEFFKGYRHYPTIDLIETIEALREVARLGRNVVRDELFGLESYDEHASIHELEDRIRFLPDWILE